MILNEEYVNYLESRIIELQRLVADMEKAMSMGHSCIICKCKEGKECDCI